MFKLKNICCALSFIFLFSALAAAQTVDANRASKSYDVLLQVLVSGGAGDLPPALADAGRKLKLNFPAANFSLSNTFMGKASDGGSLSHKGLAAMALQSGISTDAPVFSEYYLNQLKRTENNLQIETFRYGMRVPVKTLAIKTEAGKESPVINYEQIGLTVNRLTLSENVPTVIGTLTTSKPNEIIVLVLTIKPESL